MEILTTESIHKFKLAFDKEPEIVRRPFNEIKKEHNLLTIDRYYLDEDIKLVYSESNNQETNDYTNSGLIGEALPRLTPADATDERLWITLCLNQYKNYVLSRWPNIADGKHFFCGGYRHLTRNNGIARLWWSKHNSKKMNTNDNDVIKAFFEDIDRRQQLIERGTSSNNRKILKVIFEIVTEENKNGRRYDRTHYRNFLKKINFMGKRKSLPAMDEIDLKELFLGKYVEN